MTFHDWWNDDDSWRTQDEEEMGSPHQALEQLVHLHASSYLCFYWSLLEERLVDETSLSPIDLDGVDVDLSSSNSLGLLSQQLKLYQETSIWESPQPTRKRQRKKKEQNY